MSKVLMEITMSLDGYTAGPDISDEAPLGRDGERLHDWMFAGNRRRRSIAVAWTMTPEGRRRVRNCSRYVDVPAVQAAAY